MTATPMRLEDALRFNGYTIDTYESPAFTVATEGGSIAVPEMILSKLTWRHEQPAPLNAALYLDKLPCFAEAYKPVQLSHLLDWFRGRRLAYDTLDEFGTAVRRWANIALGPGSAINQRFISAALPLPLSTVDMDYNGSSSGTDTSSSSSTDTKAASSEDTAGSTSTDTSTSSNKGRNAQSDFPQGLLAGGTDYASRADDQVASAAGSADGTTAATRSGSSSSTDTSSSSSTDTKSASDVRTEFGRSGRSVMELVAEQRELIWNVNFELRDSAESLFLGVFDRSESESSSASGFRYGSRSWGW